MSKFKKKQAGGVPKISTASLPDVIFMLLFFFMISTVMRETTLKVEQIMPEASEVQKLERKNLVSYIYVGKPKREYMAQYGTEDALQLNDSFESVDKIKDFVYAEKESRRPEERDALTFSIKGDVNSKMGIFTDIKQELRKANALKINYSARQGVKK
ncbi:MAG: biopolymer transporter ExbD [Flavobacteriales bacterium]|nr:biopolymer transporter ExbD [Flavobacteriales bacterium]